MAESLLERYYAAALINETSSSSPGYQPLFEEEIGPGSEQGYTFAALK